LRKRTKHTLMAVRRMVAESKAALAGRIVEVFVRSKASMAAFKSVSHSFGRRGSASMVERDSWERTVCEAERSLDVNERLKSERVRAQCAGK